MPAKKVARRGGVVRVRTITLEGGRYARVYVVRKPGPHGGHTILGERRQAKTKGK